MTSSWVVTLCLLLLCPWISRTCSDVDSDDKRLQHQQQRTTGRSQNVEKRSVLTFPPSSVFQITMGVTLSGHLERNHGAVVLAFQQNGPLPTESEPLLYPSLVVSGRKFSIYDHLQKVFSSYGFNGTECLKKMVCQIGETPLLEGLVEDVISFVLSPSKHRSVLFEPQGHERKYLDDLLESERVGNLGGNCSSAYPDCRKTPLDFISVFL